ncbi:GTPase, partial [bacterium]|nr:GTPase [bacterium]
PVETPPLEVVKKGNQAILDSFKDLKEQGIDRLYEAKLLIVGEGESGKTTLAWKLKDIRAAMPKKGDDRTKGIDIQALEVVNIHMLEKPFRINVWDFGGQEIYHATHQFFLTKRSLYVIVNNTRSNLTDFNQWLQTISLFSDNSPVIIVQNQVAGSPVDLDLRGLQAHFSNILFVKDADLSNTEDGRLQKLIQSIELGI